MDILTPIVNDEKQHEWFRALISDPVLEPAKLLLEQIAKEFKDIDGNFVEQFQSTGFNQRIWELFLFQYFHESGFNIKREGDNPDFFISKDGLEIAVEAVTSNPTDGDKQTDELVKQAFDCSNPERQKKAQRLIIDQTTIKLGSALYSKLKKEYWKMDHISNKSLVFAIEAYHHSHANYFPDYKMISYLYGFVINEKLDGNGISRAKFEYIKEYEHEGKKIPYGFFELPESENISAVIFTNTGNLDKFNRMGKQEGLGNKRIVIARAGTRNSLEGPKDFEYYVNKQQHLETWGEGVSICHNPKARFPIPHEIFKNHRQIWVTKDGLDGYMPNFFPFTSVTMGTIVPE